MTLETRARRAAKGIHRAVEVMEMAKSTKEPTLLEPFERLVEQKERNRRRGAVLIAGAIACVLLVIVAIASFGGANETVPASARVATPQVASRAPIEAGTITVDVSGCSLTSPGTIEAFGATTTSGLLTFEVDNGSSQRTWFDLVRIDTSAMPYDEFVAETDRAARRADRGGKIGTPPDAVTVMTTAKIGANGSGAIEALASAGTYSVVCMRELGGGDLAPDTTLGPVVLT